jgi:predicted nuclease with TOPRIM domain
VSIVSLRDLAVARREQDLQEKEEEINDKLKRERRDLESHSVELCTREAAVEAKHERLQKTREDLCNRELSISFQEGTLASRDNAPSFQGERSWLTRRSG